VSPHNSRAAMGRRPMPGVEPWREPPPRDLLPRGRDMRRDAFMLPQCAAPHYGGMPPNGVPPGWVGFQGPGGCCSGLGPGSWPPHGAADGYRGNFCGGPREAGWHDPAMSQPPMRNHRHEANGAGHSCAAPMGQGFAAAHHRVAVGGFGGGMARAGMDRAGLPGARMDNRMSGNDGGAAHHFSPPGCCNPGMYQGNGPPDYMPCASHSRSEPEGYAGTATGGMDGQPTAPKAGYSCGEGGCAYSANERRCDERRDDCKASCPPGGQANLAPRSSYDAGYLPPVTAQPAVPAPPAQASSNASEANAGNQDALWTKFRQAVVEFAKPLLRGAAMALAALWPFSFPRIYSDPTSMFSFGPVIEPIVFVPLRI
jgi:hypothetical protein